MLLSRIANRLVAPGLRHALCLNTASTSTTSNDTLSTATTPTIKTISQNVHGYKAPIVVATHSATHFQHKRHVHVSSLLSRLSLNDAKSGLATGNPQHRGLHTSARLNIRMLTLKRRRMNKLKLKKRRKRDAYQIMRHHEQKKATAETKYRGRMNAVMLDAIQFDAAEYVKEFLKKTKWVPTEKLTEKGTPWYPHWLTLMTWEELYGIPESKHILKSSGLPSPEDAAEIERKRAEYYEKLEEFKRLRGK